MANQTQQTKKYISALLQTENEHLQMLHNVVAESIEEEKLIVQNLKNTTSESLTFGQKISDKVAKFGGSWAFIISFLSIMTVWIVFNIFAVTQYKYDPYPFILLNLALSCIAALQAPIIMMSQNRQEEKDRERAENDYLINLKSELELRNLHRKMDLLLEEHMHQLIQVQATQLEKMEQLQKHLQVQDALLRKHLMGEK